MMTGYRSGVLEVYYSGPLAKANLRGVNVPAPAWLRDDL
jgi:hypothetical protein